MENATITATLEQFQTALATAASLGAQVASNEAIVLQEEATLLERLLTDLKPVMRYIDSPIRESGCCAGGQWSQWRYQLMAERGILLAGSLEQNRESSDQHRGTYGGHDLILSRSGTLHYRTFAGSWSHWQSEPDSWSAVPLTADGYDDYSYEDDVYTPIVASTTPVTPKEALALYPLEDLITGITSALATAIEKAHTKAHTLSSRLARISAIHKTLNT